jgi:hypothetical protein
VLGVSGNSARIELPLALPFRTGDGLCLSNSPSSSSGIDSGESSCSELVRARVSLLAGFGTSLLVVGSHMTPPRSPPVSPYEWAAADAARNRGSIVGLGYSFRYDGNAVLVPCALSIRFRPTDFRGIAGAVRSCVGGLTGSGSVSPPDGGTAYTVDADPSPALK